MQLTLETSISMITVLIQGLLSFFSPCVFPLVPLYMSYLAGGMQEVDEKGEIIYPRKKIFIHTVAFVLGIGVCFLLLGFGFTVAGQFFKDYRVWFARISGIIMIFFGLYQLGAFGKSKVLEGEHRLQFDLGKWTMNPLTAWLLGFTFSFAWTPCVGPTLTSVLLMAGTSGTTLEGLALILVYISGFTVPFLAVGMFTGEVLTFFRKHMNIVKYTVKIGAVVLIIMGIMTLTGWMNGVTSYLSGLVSNEQTATEEQEVKEKEEEKESAETEDNPKVETSPDAEENEEGQEQEERPEIPAPDITLKDQYGVEHSLLSYKGKTVFLNFWATWCGPCKKELPDIQKMYEEYGMNEENIVVLGITNPGGQDVSKEEISTFLEENGFTYPTLFDETGEIFSMFGVSSFPTTFMIDANGNIYGYVTGMLTEDMMKDIVQQTMDSVITE